MKKTIIYIFICIALMSCKKTEDVSQSSAMLSINEVVVQPSESISKAALWGSTLPNSSRIGLTLIRTNTQSSVVSNTMWQLSGNTWNTSNSVPLNSDQHTAYVYYPYIASVTDIEAIPVTYNQSDYMSGVSNRTDLSSTQSSASFVLRRAMTRVAIFIRKETTYFGAGRLTYICLRNTVRKRVLPTDASLLTWNIKTNTITQNGLPEAGSSLKLFYANDEISYPVTLPTTIGASSVGDAIFAPVDNFEDGDIEISLIVDGQEYVVPISPPRYSTNVQANGGFKAGFNYRYALTLTPKHVTISPIVVNDWVEVEDEIKGNGLNQN